MGQLWKIKRGMRASMKMPLTNNPLLSKSLFTGIKPARMLGKSIVAPPGVGSTQTFMTIGQFDTELEAINCQKYINTKFVKCLLSLRKCTQDNSPATWEYIPLQDFTAASDIDWTKSLSKIDEQLYRKYNLTWQEILFIETHYAHGRDCS